MNLVPSGPWHGVGWLEFGGLHSFILSSINPNTFGGGGEGAKKTIFRKEEGREGGGKKCVQRTLGGMEGGGLEPGTYSVLGEGPQLHVMGVV